MIQITKKLTGKKYWRSLDQYYQTPEFQEWLNREFPSQSAEMLDEPSRRNILKLMGASFALGGLTACRRPVEHILPFSKGVENFVHGKPLYYNTVMSLGGEAMGLTVKTNEGRPTKIEGNADASLEPRSDSRISSSLRSLALRFLTRRSRACRRQRVEMGRVRQLRPKSAGLVRQWRGTPVFERADQLAILRCGEDDTR